MMKKIIPILGVTVLILFLIIIVIKVQKHEKGRYGKIEEFMGSGKKWEC